MPVLSPADPLRRRRSSLFDPQPVAQATNAAAQSAFGRTGQMANTTVGGNYGGAITNPSNVLSPQQVMAQASGNQFAPTGAQPLGGYATTPGGFASRMQQENPMGAFGGTLPVIGADGRPTFAAGPMKAPMLQPPSVQRYSPGEGTTFSHAVGGEQLRATPEQQARVKAALAAGMTGRSTADRKAAASERNAARIAGRGNAYELAQARKESRQLNKGVLTFEQRLAAANPAAAQGRRALEAQSEGQISLAENQMNQRSADAKAQRDLLAAEGSANRENRLAIAGINNGLAPGGAADKAKLSDDDYRQMRPADAAQHMIDNGVPPAEVNRRMRLITGGQNHNWYQEPGGPGRITGIATPLAPNQPPVVGDPNRAGMGGGMGLPPAPPSVGGWFAARERERLKNEARGGRVPK